MRIQRLLKVFCIFGVLSLVIFTFHQARESDLFLLENVEIQDDSDGRSIDSAPWIQYAGIPVGQRSLLDLDLKALERRILSYDEIRSVVLQKKMPHTLSISMSYREPIALFQHSQGMLSYMDAEGQTFSRLQGSQLEDLPVLSQFFNESPGRVQEALHFVQVWENSMLGRYLTLSAVDWHVERGFRVWIVYPTNLLQVSPQSESSAMRVPIRTGVEFGAQLIHNLDFKLLQLSNVFHYLIKNSIAARSIWIEGGKKIVVKKVHGS